MRNKIWNAIESGKLLEAQAQQMREQLHEESAEDLDGIVMQKFQKVSQFNHAFQKLRVQEKEKRKQRKK